jgi:hypothetical protein
MIWAVLAFVFQHTGDLIECVRVPCAFAQRHQEHRIILPDAIVHSLLKRDPLRRHDVVILDLKLVRCPIDSRAPAHLKLAPSPTRSPLPLRLYLLCLPRRSLGGGGSLIPISSIETPSLPTLARSYPRHFTFYVADPISSIRNRVPGFPSHTQSLVDSRRKGRRGDRLDDAVDFNRANLALSDLCRLTDVLLTNS